MIYGTMLLDYLKKKIIRIEGNFWDIGEGPSGPNTEIFYDRGEDADTWSPKRRNVSRWRKR